MADKVPALSMTLMAVMLVVSLAIPVGLFLYYRLKKKADYLPFFAGILVFFLFALVLEGTINNLILVQAPFGGSIRDNTWAYALYGGLMAGLFEETGRFLAFRFMRSRELIKPDRDINACMYGAGHGGIEAAAVLGLGSISNLANSLAINTGAFESLTAGLSGDLLAQAELIRTTLITTPSWQYLIGGAERIFAVVLQIALSVLVWFAVTRKDRRFLFPLAIALHLIADAVPVVLVKTGMNAVAVEAVIGLISAAVAVFAFRVWKKNAGESEKAKEECLSE